MPEKQSKSLLSLVDGGELDSPEAKADLSKIRSGELRKGMMNIFKAYQRVAKHKDLQLDIQQMFKVFHTLRPGTVSKEEVSDLFVAMDEDCSGRVSFIELVRFLFGSKQLIEQSLRGEIVRPRLHIRIFEADGESRPSQQLQGWTDESVTFARNGQMEEFRSPASVQVFGAQDDDELISFVPALVDEWAMMFTQSMLLVASASQSERQSLLGTREELARPDSGILFQIFRNIFEYTQEMQHLKQLAHGQSQRKHFVGVSLLEFRDGQCHDLIANDLPVAFGSNGPLARSIGIESITDLGPLLAYASEHRRGNGQFAWHFKLYRRDVDPFGDFVHPGEIWGSCLAFSVVEMTDIDDVSNSELALVQDEIQKVAEANTADEYSFDTKMRNQFVQYISMCFTGHFKPTVTVCLSQNPDFESQNRPLFELGNSMAQLALPLHKVKPRALDKLLADARKSYEAAQSKLQTMEVDSPVWPAGKCTVMALKQELEIWQALR